MITPLRDYVLLEEVKQEEGKIMLASDVDIEKPDLALVLSGEHQGKTVLYKPYMFQKIILDKTYLIGKEEGIFAIYEQNT